MADFTDRLMPAHDGTASIQAERNGSAIHVPQLARHLLGRDGFLDRQEKVLKVLRGEKLFCKEQQLNLSRPERYHLGLARAKAIQRLIRREKWDHQDAQMAEYLNDEMSPYFLHMSMFGEQHMPYPRQRDMSCILVPPGLRQADSAIMQSPRYGSKHPRSSSTSGCLKSSIMTSLAATPRLNLVMGAMSGGWRRQPPGILKRKSSRYTAHT